VEGLYLRQLLCDLGIGQDHLLLNGDNQGALALAKNNIRRDRSKHIDVKFHFIRQCVDSGKLKRRYVQSAYNVADVFTKPATKAKLSAFVSFLFGAQCDGM
jgi:hypothetical protein